MAKKHTREVLKYINNTNFFRDYCPEIRTYIFKARGMSINNKPIDFTLAEKEAIADGLERMVDDAFKVLFD